MDGNTELILALSPANLGSYCTICAYEFSDSLLPFVLGCGHTFCSPCITKLDSWRGYRCPNCKKKGRKCNKNCSLIEVIIRKYCPIHWFELSAYCILHDELLCIECVLAHKEDDILLINSPKIPKIVKEKEKLLKDYENEVNYNVGKVKKNFKKIKSIKMVNKRFDKIISKLIKSKDEAIKGINEKLSNCVEEIENLANKNEINVIEHRLNENLRDLEATQNEILEKKNKFLDREIINVLNFKNQDMKLCIQCQKEFSLKNWLADLLRV